MTIPELAKEFNLSAQAVYKRLNRNGINRKDLLKDNTSQLTVDGEKIIRELYVHSKKVGDGSLMVQQQKLKGLTNTGLKDLVTDLKQQNSALQIEYDHQKEKIADLTERLAKSEERYDILLKAAFATNLISGKKDHDEKHGLKERIRILFTGK